MGLKVKGKKGTNDLENEEVKVKANEKPTLKQPVISTLLEQNKNTPHKNGPLEMRIQ